jgi:hypothetical protein
VKKKKHKRKGTKMPKFQVSVLKRLYCTGVIEVSAKDAQAAVDEVTKKIATGELQTKDPNIEWEDPEYEDGSFETIWLE